ncbi:hypothetical protein N9A86_02085 [Akkermansiaceae bacterium]|nr:hypothetical protein [Akkermansiaceae bacterium]MDB4538256.1 hypothetical protein [Akkermansiaceae bacterium]
MRSVPAISRRLLSQISRPPVDDDTDDDGVPNDYETLVGSDPNPANADADHDFDGVTLIDEYLSGTLDNDPLSRLHITSIIPAPGGWTISWQSVVGKNYGLLATEDFSLPLATVAGTNTTATSTTSSVTISWLTTPISTFFAIKLIQTP